MNRFTMKSLFLGVLLLSLGTYVRSEEADLETVDDDDVSVDHDELSADDEDVPDEFGQDPGDVLAMDDEDAGDSYEEDSVEQESFEKIHDEDHVYVKPHEEGQSTQSSEKSDHGTNENINETSSSDHLSISQVLNDTQKNANANKFGKSSLGSDITGTSIDNNINDFNTNRKSRNLSSETSTVKEEVSHDGVSESSKPFGSNSEDRISSHDSKVSSGGSQPGEANETQNPRTEPSEVKANSKPVETDKPKESTGHLVGLKSPLISPKPATVTQKEGTNIGSLEGHEEPSTDKRNLRFHHEGNEHDFINMIKEVDDDTDDDSGKFGKEFGRIHRNHHHRYPNDLRHFNNPGEDNHDSVANLERSPGRESSKNVDVIDEQAILQHRSYVMFILLMICIVFGICGITICVHRQSEILESGSDTELGRDSVKTYNSVALDENSTRHRTNDNSTGQHSVYQLYTTE